MLDLKGIYVPKTIDRQLLGFSAVPTQVIFLTPTGKSNELCNKIHFGINYANLPHAVLELQLQNMLYLSKSYCFESLKISWSGAKVLHLTKVST